MVKKTCKRKTYKKRKGTTKKIFGTYKKLKIKRTKRKGKISPWIKAGIAAVAPSIIATGYGTIKHLLRDKYAGYSNIYA